MLKLNYLLNKKGVKMSETNETQASSEGVKLNGLYAFKEGMATVYNEKGEAVPVTVLRYETWKVSQIKTADKDGYSAVQLAAVPKKSKNASSAEVTRLKAAGFESGAQYVRELRTTEIPEGLKLGDYCYVKVNDATSATLIGEWVS